MVGSRRKKSIINEPTIKLKSYLLTLYIELIEKTEDFLERSNYKFIVKNLKDPDSNLFNCMHCSIKANDNDAKVCERCLKVYHNKMCFEKHICKIRLKQ